MTRYAVSKPQALRLDLSTASEYLNHQLRVTQEVRSRFKCPPPDLASLYNANLSELGPAFRTAPRSVPEKEAREAWSKHKAEYDLQLKEKAVKLVDADPVADVDAFNPKTVPNGG